MLIKVSVGYLIFLILLFHSFLLIAQKEQKVGYLIYDTVYMEGFIKQLSDWRIEYRKSKTASPKTFTSDYIREFSYDGKEFEAMDLNGSKVFVLRLISGKVKFYEYKKSRYIKIGDTLESFNSKNYRIVFKSKFNCEGNNSDLQKLNYSRASIKYFIQSYNRGVCNYDKIPSRKVGIVGSYGFYNFTTNSRYIDGDIDKTSTETFLATAGLIMDLPIYSVPSLYFSTELHGISVNLLIDESKSDGALQFRYDAKFSGVIMPIMGKWNFNLGSKVNPYIKVGGFTSYLLMKSEEDFFDYVVGIGSATRELETSGNVLFGFITGAGTEISFKKRKIGHIELRYLKSSKASFQALEMNFDSIQIMLGVSI